MDTQLEEVARALLLTVRGGLASALVDVATEMQAKDTDFFTAMGQTVSITPLDPPVVWDIGHHPSILEWGLDLFPNVCAMAYDHRSDAQPGDQYDMIRNTAYVECFSAHADESTINRIAWRYAKALNRVVSQDPTLDGLVEPIQFSPTVLVSNASARRVTDLSDQIVYLQGCRLEYDFLIPEQVDVWGGIDQ